MVYNEAMDFNESSYLDDVYEEAKKSTATYEQYRQQRTTDDMVQAMKPKEFTPGRMLKQLEKFYEARIHMHQADVIRLMTGGPYTSPFSS